MMLSVAVVSPIHENNTGNHAGFLIIILVVVIITYTFSAFHKVETVEALSVCKNPHAKCTSLKGWFVDCDWYSMALSVQIHTGCIVLV